MGFPPNGELLLLLVSNDDDVQLVYVDDRVWYMFFVEEKSHWRWELGTEVGMVSVALGPENLLVLE